jgi:hypothetical protein
MQVINYLRDNGYTGSLDIFKDNTQYYDLFITKLNTHSIYKYIVETDVNCRINTELILNYLHNNDKITNKTRILTCDISNNKHKKIRRLLTIFKLKYITNKHSSANSIYIRKLKLGYITMNKLHRDFVNYVVSNDMDTIYYDVIIKIIDFISSKYKNHKVSKKELHSFIIHTIKEADNIYNDKFCDKPQIIMMSNTTNLIHDSLKHYITLYNKNKHILERFPYLQYFKDCSDHGYYYPDELRALEWDYTCSANWDIVNDFDEQLKRINKNTKLNTLISIYKELFSIKLFNANKYFCCYRNQIPPNSINKRKLQSFIEKYSNGKLDDVGVSMEFKNVNITIQDFVGYCQTYYSNNLVFTLITTII